MDTSGIMYATDAPQLNSGFWALASVVVAVCCGADQSEARDLRLLHHREVPREEWYQEALLTVGNSCLATANAGYGTRSKGTAGLTCVLRQLPWVRLNEHVLEALS